MPVYKFDGPDSKMRLDKFLSKRLPDLLSRTEIQKQIKLGKVTVDAAAVFDPAINVSAGQKIVLKYQPVGLVVRPDIILKIVYEDENLLVIDKPAGLTTHPTRANQKASVAAALAAVYPDLPSGQDAFRPGIVHRLDADTSGLLVVAKTQTAYDYLKNLFKIRQVTKQYLALVHGKVETQHGVLDQAMGRKAGQGRFSAGFGRPAKTEYWVEGYWQSNLDKFTCLKIQLHTGRTHQIRVHFAAIKHPLAGDKLYGGRFKKHDTDLFPRQFLHASSIKFVLPGGREKEFISPLPEDLRHCLGYLKQD